MLAESTGIVPNFIENKDRKKISPSLKRLRSKKWTIHVCTVDYCPRRRLKVRKLWITEGYKDRFLNPGCHWYRSGTQYFLSKFRIWIPKTKSMNTVPMLQYLKSLLVMSVVFSRSYLMKKLQRTLLNCHFKLPSTLFVTLNALSNWPLSVFSSFFSSSSSRFLSSSFSSSTDLKVFSTTKI